MFGFTRCPAFRVTPLGLGGVRQTRILTAVGVVIALMFAALAQAAGPKPLPFEALFGGPFTLSDHTGQVRRDTDFRGRLMLVSFGYTHCPDICPTTLQLVTEALDLLGKEASGVQPLFITLDPGRDDIETLAAYVDAFHPGIVGLTGTEAQVRAVAKVYKVHRHKVVLADARDDEYLVDHGSNIYLMDVDGRFVTLFHFSRTDAEAMAATIRKYLPGKRS